MSESNNPVSPQRILMVGCGGVGSYLLRPLMLTFPEASVELWDGDVLEEKNLKRQNLTLESARFFIMADSSGKTVGDIISKMSKLDFLELDGIHERVDKVHSYFLEGAKPSSPPDAIICCCDNNTARKLLFKLADELDVPLFVGANEYFDSEAWVWDRRRCNWDVKTHLKNIFDSPEDGPGAGCEAQLESSPQLACANLTAASLVLGLMWRWFRIWEPNTEFLKNQFHDVFPCRMTINAYEATRFPE